jgi:hypothetical protein
VEGAEWAAVVAVVGVEWAAAVGVEVEWAAAVAAEGWVDNFRTRADIHFVVP